MIYSINPPNSDDMQEVLGVFAAVSKTFAIDMHELFNANLTPEMGPDWFSKIKKMRSPHLADTSAGDPTFYLKEPAHNMDSPSWKFLPKDNGRFKTNLFKLLAKRNDWAHYDVEPNIDNLSKAVVIFEEVALVLHLPHAPIYSQIRDRCAGILNGSYQPLNSNVAFEPVAVALTSDQELSQIENEFVREIQEAVELGLQEVQRKTRPQIGSPWEGPVGKRKIRLIRATSDVYDLLTHESVKHELGENADRIIANWMNVLSAPSTDIEVDEDGAMAAPVNGQKCLVGYFGDLPEPDPRRPRGFLTSRHYKVSHGEVVDEEFHTKLTFHLTEGIDLGSYENWEVRTTTFNDVSVTDPVTLERVKIGSI